MKAVSRSSVARRVVSTLPAWAVAAPLLLLAGCGQKGPLTLPPAVQSAAPAASVAPASAPSR
ncbi:MAG: lipoprotein [Rubrivivax sp.]|nr:lipoprotein [Rubrivivax sp.]